MTSASTFSDPPAAKKSSPPTSEQPSLVQIKAPETVQLPPRPTPSLPENYFLHGQEPQQGAVIVLHRERSLRDIIDHSTSNLRAEVGGVLLGRAYQEQERFIVEVQAALPAVSGDHGPVHFTFTADAWSQIHHDKAEKYPQLDIVGWFHTHPGLGVFYSSDDVVVHSAAFTMPWHVGFVVDPLRSEAAYFGWVAGELSPLAGYYEIQQNSEKAVAPWGFVRTSVWHERETEEFYANYEKQEADDGEKFNTYEMLAAPWSNPLMLGIALGTVGLLLSFILLVFFILPLRREVNGLETAVQALVTDTDALNTTLCPAPELRLYTPLANSSFTRGTKVHIIGTAVWPTASRFRLESRLAGSSQWVLLHVQRRAETMGTLTVWDTTDIVPGEYDLRLTAVDRNNIRLAQAPICTLPLTITQ